MIIRFACIVSAAVLLPTAAAAATYSAKPVVPVAAKRIIQRDIIWSCGPAACQGMTEYGRPTVLCQALAQQAGAIEHFIVDGRALSNADLDTCNRAAHGARPAAVARN